MEIPKVTLSFSYDECPHASSNEELIKSLEE